jgi:thymidylate synthase
VLETLRRDAHVSYATITTLEPLTDVSYIPCVSLLDFWLRSGSLELVVYAHSIDFGKKGFGNLVQLAELQRDVASELNVPVGPLVMIVKSATIYQTELSLMSEMISSAQRAGKKATSASKHRSWCHTEQARLDHECGIVTSTVFTAHYLPQR